MWNSNLYKVACSAIPTKAVAPTTTTRKSFSFIETNSISHESVTEGIGKSEDLELYYDVLLGLTNKFKEKFGKRGINEFEIFRRTNVSIPMVVIGTFLLTLFFVTRGSLQNIWYFNGYFLTGFAVAVLDLFILTLVIILRLILFTKINIKSPKLLELKRKLITFSSTRSGRALESFLIITAPLGVGMYGLGRVMHPCSAINRPSMWDTQECNTQAATNGIPNDYLLFQVSVVLLGQIFVKGCKREALLLGWVISFVMLNLNLVIVGSLEYPAVDILFFLLIASSYEIERYSVSFFIHKKLELVIGNQLATAMARAQFLDKENIFEKHMNAELQANITNSAHDIRSPCCALILAIDSLMTNELALRDKHPSPLIDANLSIIESIAHTISSVTMIVDRTTVSN